MLHAVQALLQAYFIGAYLHMAVLADYAKPLLKRTLT